MREDEHASMSCCWVEDRGMVVMVVIAGCRGDGVEVVSGRGGVVGNTLMFEA